MPGKTHITKKLDEAGEIYLKAYFAAVNQDTPFEIEGFDPAENIYRGRSAQDKTGPCVIAWCESAKEDPDVRGNYWARFHVIVKFPTGDEDETEEDFKTLVGIALDAIATPDFCAQLSALSDQVDGLHCFGTRAAADDNGASEEDPDTWMEKRTIEIYCCPSKVDE